MERELDLQILVNKENQADLTPIQSIREFKNQLCEWTYSSTNKCSYNQLWIIAYDDILMWCQNEKRVICFIFIK